MSGSVWAAVAAFVVSTVVFTVVRTTIFPLHFGDLRIYQIEGRAVVHGWDLYGQLPGVSGHATYPPFAAMVFAVTGALATNLLVVINFVFTVAALVLVSLASCWHAGLRGQRLATCGFGFAAVGIWAEPIATTFMYGQINLYLLALILIDFALPEDCRWRGVATGIAAGLKVTPALFIVYLALTGRYRAALTSVITFAATVALSTVVSARDTVAYWTGHLFDIDRVGRLENSVNQTLRGWLVRADHTRAKRRVSRRAG